MNEIDNSIGKNLNLVIKGDDVYSKNRICSACDINRTLPLKIQIEDIFRLVGKVVEVKIVEVDKTNKPSPEMKEHIEQYHNIVHVLKRKTNETNPNT